MPESSRIRSRKPAGGSARGRWLLCQDSGCPCSLNTLSSRGDLAGALEVTTFILPLWALIRSHSEQATFMRSSVKSILISDSFTLMHTEEQATRSQGTRVRQKSRPLQGCHLPPSPPSACSWKNLRWAHVGPFLRFREDSWLTHLMCSPLLWVGRASHMTERWTNPRKRLFWRGGEAAILGLIGTPR